MLQQTLHLPLKAKWYYLQESGEKTEEYREITPYWRSRLCNRSYTHVCFRLGYTEHSFTRNVDSITIGRGRTEWGAPADRDVFIIKHH